MKFSICLAAILLVVVSERMSFVDGHGRLLEPPGRSSMWRVAESDKILKPFKNVIEKNYNDNQLFCGGSAAQKKNNGKCGICGDNYADKVKQNEAGGKYAKGIITRYYTQGQNIEAMVDLTAAHKGFFEFRICPYDSVTGVEVTQECLNRHLLRFDDGVTRRNVTTRGKVYMTLQLPKYLTCSQCVLQWRYHTGNSWDCSAKGRCGVGLGPQEEFYGCSDVRISQGSSPIMQRPPSTSSSWPTTTTTTSRPSTTSRDTRTTTTSKPSRYTTTSTIPSSTTSKNHPISPPVIDCSMELEDTGKYQFLTCNIFYICVGGKAYIFSCEPGTVFNKELNVCDFPWSVPGCEDGIVLYSSFNTYVKFFM